MKKGCWFFMMLLMVLCFCRGTAQGPAVGMAGNDNLVSNPGFEDGEAPWQLDNWGKNEVRAGRDSKNPHSGTWSMRVELIKVLNFPVVMYAYPRLRVRPGSAVRVRFWARGVSNGANLTVMVRREADPRPTYLRTETNLTDEWQQYTYTIQLPGDADPNATSLRFALNQAGVFWIDDVSVEELPPMDNGPSSAVNPIRNGSFEAGRDGWTAGFRKREFGTPSQESGNGAPAPEDARLEIGMDSGAPQGQRYLRVLVDTDCRAAVTSAYFPARYGHKGQLRFFLRSGGDHAFAAGIGAGVNSGSAVQTQPQRSSGHWRAYSVPFTLKPAQDGVYFVNFRFNEPGLYEIDGVAFVEDELPGTLLYPPAVAIQPLAGAPAANLYSPHDTAVFRLVVAGERPGFSSEYKIDVVDYMERKIAGYAVAVSCDARGYGEKMLKVPTGLFGAFRVEARGSPGQGKTGSEGAKDAGRGNEAKDAAGLELLAEQIYSVLPALPPPGERPDSYFGGHVDLTAYNLAIARKGGFRWLRMWPPLTTTWIAAEPKPGVWNFPTAAVANAYREGFRISGILGTAPDFEADTNPKSSIKNRWSRAYPPVSIDAWKEYAGRCVTAFYPYIANWEVWNEPDGGYLQVRPELKKYEVYNSLLKAAREVIDSIGKPVTLLGPAVASINAPLGWEVLQNGGGRWLDAFSFHFYSLAAGGDNPDDAFVLPLLKKFRTYPNRSGVPMPLWHTEGGMYLQGGRSWLATYRIPTSSPSRKQNAAAAMVRAALFFKAMGVKHYFDFALYTTAAGSEINGDATAGFIEVTGIPGPGVAAHAAMVALTEDAAPAGFDDFGYHSARVKAAHFKSAKGGVDVYWSDRPVSLKGAAGLQATDRVVDMMGNPVDGEHVSAGEFPLYVIRGSR
ncbi:MAG TPA: carbohydrate binding domain-containing protein [Puia sp.]